MENFNESEAAGDLREARSNTAIEDNDTDEQEDYYYQVKRQQAEERKKRSLEEKKTRKISPPGNPATSGTLRWAWTLLLPSFGLTLIYINIHWILSLVLGEKLFCKLGDEWLNPWAAALNKSGTIWNLLEPLGVLFLDFVVFCVVLSGLTFFMFIVDVAMHPLDYTTVLLQVGWDGIWSGLKVLFAN